MTVSAVIPVKNRPALIIQAIKSCLVQTSVPDEIIVVDDGSDDTTPDMVTEMARVEFENQARSPRRKRRRGLGPQ